MLHIDILDVGRGPHDARRFVAVDQAETVPQFVDRLLQEPPIEQVFISRQAVHLRIEAMDGDDRRRSRQLCFTEYIGQNRYEEIDAAYTEYVVDLRRSVIQEQPQQGGGIVLPPGGVE